MAPFSPITNLQGAGDDNVGYEGVIRVPGQASIVGDFVAIRAGRAAMLFSCLNDGAQLRQAPQIVNAVINRVGQAGA